MDRDCLKCGKNSKDVPFSKRKDKPGYYYPYCNKCNVERVVKWHEDNPLYKPKKSSGKVSKDGYRWIHLKRTYGLTREEYTSILENQNGCCRICGGTPKGGKHSLKHLWVDHDHETGQVRGLLCNHCNTVLGQAKDSIEILQSAVQYLEYWKDKSRAA